MIKSEAKLALFLSAIYGLTPFLIMVLGWTMVLLSIQYGWWVAIFGTWFTLEAKVRLNKHTEENKEPKANN